MTSAPQNQKSSQKLEAPLIHMQLVNKAFKLGDRNQVVLSDFDLEVYRGDVLCLIGPSGSGKSTCLRVINALETIDSGRIEVCGRDYQTSKLALYQIRQKTAMVFQRFELFPHLTVLENVAIGPKFVQKLKSQAASDKAQMFLERVGLKDHLHKYPSQLSGGQQQRVSIARALANDPEVLLCDEPTSALDPELVHEVTDILQGLAREGMTMLIVTHEMNFAKRIAKECLFLEAGKIVERAAPAPFFDDPRHPRLRQFLQNLVH